LSWNLNMVTNMDLISVLCRQILSFPSNICWRDCRFSIACFWHLCQK
jgi:hypothetical protein